MSWYSSFSRIFWLNVLTVTRSTFPNQNDCRFNSQPFVAIEYSNKISMEYLDVSDNFMNASLIYEMKYLNIHYH